MSKTENTSRALYRCHTYYNENRVVQNISRNLNTFEITRLKTKIIIYISLITIMQNIYINELFRRI